MTTEYIIDATGKKLGRIASEAAKALLGKRSASYARGTVADVRVLITNATKLDVTDKKRRQEVRKRYSGYPGGQKVESLGAYMERKSPSDALKLAITRMLPKNTLRKERLKRLTITK